MSRYVGPRVRIVRRLGGLPGLTRKGRGKLGYTSQYTPNRKASQYRIRLEEKQKLRFYYGLTEQQLLRYVRTARRARGSTGQVLLQLLETRLDNLLFQLGMAPTIPGARQLVTHKHVLVNDRVIGIPSYRCEPGDAIALRPGRTAQQQIVDNPGRAGAPRSALYPPRLGLVDLPLADRKWTDLNMNELLVVEYYSRKA
nr:ribosomal protein S4 [Selaginella remotifolia]